MSFMISSRGEEVVKVSDPNATPCAGYSPGLLPTRINYLGHITCEWRASGRWRTTEGRRSSLCSSCSFPPHLMPDAQCLRYWKSHNMIWSLTAELKSKYSLNYANAIVLETESQQKNHCATQISSTFPRRINEIFRHRGRRGRGLRRN